jgi:Fe-S cluster biogenesis protein NfuA/nitrite reductase/ring-hydroxylating ferredoxin subunit
MTRNLREVGSRIEGLLDELRSVADESVSGRAEELVRLLVELYGAGLEKVLEILGEGPDGPELVQRLTADRFVTSLLVLHGLHPKSVEERVHEALESVRPYLGSHAGGVEFLGVDEEGVVNLRLQGSCDGCPSSTVTVKLAIERAIEEAAPEVTGVAVEGMTEPAAPAGTTVPVQIGRKPNGSAGNGSNGAWTTVSGVGAMPPGTTKAVQVEGSPVLVCSSGGELYAYRNTCPSCASTLEAASLSGEVLACSCGERYDVRRAGRGLDAEALHLDPLPLLNANNEVRIAIPTGAAST